MYLGAKSFSKSFSNGNTIILFAKLYMLKSYAKKYKRIPHPVYVSGVRCLRCTACAKPSRRHSLNETKLKR